VRRALAARLGLEIIQSDIVAKRLGVDESAVLRYVNGSASLLERWQIETAEGCFTMPPRKSCASPSRITS
jgi:hypothetical protein